MDLVIGNTSQLGLLLPDDMVKISSRNINTNEVSSYDTVYITFAEQRTFNAELKESDFIDVNVTYTTNLIDTIHKLNKKVIVYGTFELWNGYNGPVTINTPIKYNYSPYVKSKEILYTILLDKKSKGEWKNVFIIHPTNFNSVNRRKGFLFSKIFDSISNKIEIEVGDLDINRDLIHPNYLVKKSLTCDKDMIVGSGKLTNLKTFIKALYQSSGLDYNDYVIENISDVSPHKNNAFWLDTENIYNDLFEDTINEIK
tara:strand:+ start:7151 stop:7918 length:768 start_codon:yes stop_codon:yes gene_type:complete